MNDSNKQHVIPIICTNNININEELCSKCSPPSTPTNTNETQKTNPHIYCFKCKLKTSTSKKSFVLIETTNTEEHNLAVNFLKSKFPEAAIRNVIEDDSGGESDTGGKSKHEHDTIEYLEKLSLNLNSGQEDQHKPKESSIDSTSISSGSMDRQESKDSGFWSISKTSFESMKSLSINDDSNRNNINNNDTLSPNSAYSMSNWKKWKKDAAHRYNTSKESLSELSESIEMTKTSVSLDESLNKKIDAHKRRGKLIRELTIDNDEHSNNSSDVSSLTTSTTNTTTTQVPTIVVNPPLNVGGRMSPPEKRASILKQMSIDELPDTQQQQQNKFKQYAFNSFDSYLKSQIQSQNEFYFGYGQPYQQHNLLQHSASLDTHPLRLNQYNASGTLQTNNNNNNNSSHKAPSTAFNIQTLSKSMQQKEAFNFRITNENFLNQFSFNFIQPGQYFLPNEKIQFPLEPATAINNNHYNNNGKTTLTQSLQVQENLKFSNSISSKPHVCKFCQKKFARSDMLIRHSRLHSGIRPYKCNQCSQEFSRSDHLNTHQRTHTGEKPYSCPYPKCTYAACRKDMITRHLKVHNKNRILTQQQQQQISVALSSNQEIDDEHQVLKLVNLKMPKFEPID